MRKKLAMIFAAALLTFAASGCANAATTNENQGQSQAQSLETSAPAITEAIEVEAVTASGEQAEDGEVLISLSDSTGSVTITEEGTYRVTGTLSNGQIIVNAPDTAKVKLILDGASITCSGSAAIYAIGADKLVIATAEGSSNLVSSTGEFVQSDDNNVDAAIFAKCDLTLNGEGTLGISCETGHGVVSKDDLKVKGGTVSVQAAKQGLNGKDSVTIEDGTVSIVSGTDSIHSADDDAEKGNIEILGGSLYIQSGNDGIDASGTVTVTGGSLNIESGTNRSSDSGKGIKADGAISLEGGSVTVSAYDDAVHSNTTVTVLGGEFTLASGDDGIHADDELVIQDGSLNVTKSYEGLEAQQITINGGTIRVVASDDGINAAGGNDGSNANGFFGGDPFGSDSNAKLTINGGTLVINADGDGLDSNGELLVTGGTVYVSGPTNNGNGALDYGTSATITGGTVIAVGSSGMAENFGAASTQGTILVNLSSAQAAGTSVSLTDEDGNVLASFQPEKSYQSVVISAPGVTAGGSYTLTAGSYSETITMTSTVYGSGMGMGGPGGMGGQMGGGPSGGMGGHGGGPGSSGGFGGGPRR